MPFHNYPTTIQLLSNYIDSHRPRRSPDAFHGSLDRSCVQVRHFLLGDVLYLLGRDLAHFVLVGRARSLGEDRKSTRLNSSHSQISYAVFCLKKKTTKPSTRPRQP